MWTEAPHSQVRLRLVAHATRAFRDGDAAVFTHPLARRMTALQKSLVDAVHLLSLEAPDTFRSAVAEGGCPIVFASAFGELGSNLAMLLALRRHELPLSPTSFQHSVHNGPVGYLSIAFKLRNPISTISAGFLSNEKALALGAATLGWQGRADGHVLVLCADETDEPGLVATAQALLLERVEGPQAPPGLYLERCVAARVDDRAAVGSGSDAGSVPDEPLLIHDEAALASPRGADDPTTARGGALSGRVLAPLPFPGRAQARLVRSALGESMETRWISRG